MGRDPQYHPCRIWNSILILRIGIRQILERAGELVHAENPDHATVGQCWRHCRPSKALEPPDPELADAGTNWQRVIK